MNQNDRRSGPRVPLAGRAVVHAAQRQLACELHDVSTSGLLLFPPARARAGLTVRVTFALPGMSEWLDINGTLIREAAVEGRYAWGIRFDSMAPHMGTMLRTYVRRAMRGDSEPAVMSARAQRLDAAPQRDPTARARRSATGPVSAPAAGTALPQPPDDGSQPSVPSYRATYQGDGLLPSVPSYSATHQADGSQPATAQAGAGQAGRGGAAVPTQPQQGGGQSGQVPPGPEPLRVEETDPFADLPDGLRPTNTPAKDVAETHVELQEARAGEDVDDLWDDRDINLRRLYKDAVEDVGPKKKPKKKGWFG